jgi:hypothetical protein
LGSQPPGSPEGERSSPTKKAKEAEIFTCKVCNGKYTDGSGSGSGSKKNYEFCRKTRRDANAKGSLWD